jgi:hypothetical protein
MSITKSRTQAKKSAPAAPQGSALLSRFHRYWQDLEKLEAKQAKKDAEHSAIYQRFQNDIAPLELQQCQLIFQHVDKK